MYWLTRPPLLRWVAAAALLAGALAFDMSERRTEPFPFAARSLPAGAPVDDDDVEWRDVPTGLLGEVVPPAGIAIHAVTAGAPLVAGTVGDGAPIPSGWWSVPIHLPPAAAIGAKVRLVADHPPIDVQGVVSQPGSTGAFSVADPGAVAVPPHAAGPVVDAVRNGTLTVLVGT